MLKMLAPSIVQYHLQHLVDRDPKGNGEIPDEQYQREYGVPMAPRGAGVRDDCFYGDAPYEPEEAPSWYEDRLLNS